MPSARLTKHETIQQMKAWAKLVPAMPSTDDVEDLLKFEPRKEQPL